jgi:hypothetical protein
MFHHEVSLTTTTVDEDTHITQDRKGFFTRTHTVTHRVTHTVRKVLRWTGKVLNTWGQSNAVAMGLLRFDETDAWKAKHPQVQAKE